jgi:hypothetical protein
MVGLTFLLCLLLDPLCQHGRFVIETIGHSRFLLEHSGVMLGTWSSSSTLLLKQKSPPEIE